MWRTQLGRLFVSGKRRHRSGRLVVAAANGGYLLFLLVVWTALWRAGERWWPATLVLFGPRWVFALPLPVLTAASLLFNRRSIWVIGLSIPVLLFPVMDCCVPWRAAIAGQPSGPTISPTSPVCELNRPWR